MVSAQQTHHARPDICLLGPANLCRTCWQQQLDLQVAAALAPAQQLMQVEGTPCSACSGSSS
jgi:hypothetical protein